MPEYSATPTKQTGTVRFPSININISNPLREQVESAKVPIRAGQTPTLGQKLMREASYLAGPLLDLGIRDPEVKATSKQLKSKEYLSEKLNYYNAALSLGFAKLPQEDSAEYGLLTDTLARARGVVPSSYKQFVKNNENILPLSLLIDVNNKTPALVKSKLAALDAASEASKKAGEKKDTQVEKLIKKLPKPLQEALKISRGEKRLIRKDLQEVNDVLGEKVF